MTGVKHFGNALDDEINKGVLCAHISQIREMFVVSMEAKLVMLPLLVENSIASSWQTKERYLNSINKSPDFAHSKGLRSLEEQPWISVFLVEM